jgi:hypothetical protein
MRPNWEIDEVISRVGSLEAIEIAAEAGEIECTAVHTGERQELKLDFWCDNKLVQHQGSWCAVAKNWRPPVELPDDDRPLRTDLNVYSSGVTYSEDGLTTREPKWRDVLVREAGILKTWPPDDEELKKESLSDRGKRWTYEIDERPSGTNKEEVANEIAVRESADPQTVLREARRNRPK